MLIINYRWGVRLTECENGFRAIRTSVLRSLTKGKPFDIEQEMVMKALKKKYTIKEVSSHEYERKGVAVEALYIKKRMEVFWRLLIDIW